MAFTSIGYDGTVNERQWAELVPNAGSCEYGIKGAGDLKVSAVPGQPLMLSVSAGTGWGHGVIDTSTTNTTITCDTISSGTRWDLIALRRNWQPLAGGPSSIVKVTGATTKVIPAARKNEPGVEDDQPLALVQWTAGQTQPTAIIDLRVWAGNGGAVAKDDLALSYLGRLGAMVTIGSVQWQNVLKDNDVPGWVNVGGVNTDVVNLTPNGLYRHMGTWFNRAVKNAALTRSGRRVDLEGGLANNEPVFYLKNTEYILATFDPSFAPKDRDYPLPAQLVNAYQCDMTVTTNGEIRISFLVDVGSASNKIPTAAMIFRFGSLGWNS